MFRHMERSVAIPLRTARGQPDRAAHAGPAQAAVAVRVLGEVLLVVGLGVIELAGRRDLGRDLAVAGLRQLVAVRAPRQLRRLVLLLAVVEDRRAVLGARVVP